MRLPGKIPGRDSRPETPGSIFRRGLTGRILVDSWCCGVPEARRHGRDAVGPLALAEGAETVPASVRAILTGGLLPACATRRRYRHSH